MDYSFITSDMTWSHSRLTSFEDCPYRFFLKYIQPQYDEPLFFSQFGGFIHSLLAEFYSGNLAKTDLPLAYISRFNDAVFAAPPSEKIYGNYFSQGLASMRNPFMINGDILDVEQGFNFTINGLRFTGFVDLVFQNDEYGLCIVDHKSRDLKPRSTRKTPTKSDELLDQYFRQLYLYAEAVREVYGKFPNTLCFNCYRSGIQIYEPFDECKFEHVKQWANCIVESINVERKWIPRLNVFTCKNICGLHNACDYYQMFGGDKH